MLTEMVEHGLKMEEKIKAMQSEIKYIYREGGSLYIYTGQGDW